MPNSVASSIEAGKKWLQLKHILSNSSFGISTAFLTLAQTSTKFLYAFPELKVNIELRGSPQLECWNNGFWANETAGELVLNKVKDWENSY